MRVTKGGESTEGAGPAEVAIGIVTSESGPVASYGKQYLDAFESYLDDDAATARAMRGEWLRTGDVVARNAAGVLRIVDRLKDIFISGGENVASAEVEHALTLHPLVEAAAVVGVPDPVWGEGGVAFVVPARGAVLSGDEVLAHARRNLAAFKVPVRAEFVDALPRSTIEKLAPSRLRARARSLMAADRAGERDRTTEGMPR
ncbi:class I adenylate-forming enzyme family protein [Microbacterium sp. CPCC 204701]|uniref:class I adenylate-forming enzyme family protein n=1 Tax=Microbacterium sp. CPCC 204701 TaxID=2493084 RepID=UPI001F0BAB25|nr:AMP-binding protein [Microbacterium sp. CPCC 204701]